MSAFEKVIGYDEIKEELLKICDMIHNRAIYETMGAKLPQGVLLYGSPGLGKTLMAKCFIEESGIKSFVVRRNKGSDDFISNIIATFEEAKANAPSIIFLDDMDKFANEDATHRDAEEYVTVQTGIDEIKDSDVFIIATVNNIHKLPESLIRAGRFDIIIGFRPPTDDDATAIIRNFLKDKKVSEEVDLNDLSKMISYNSCAELETILNEAAIHAAYDRKESIEMADLVNIVLKKQYGLFVNTAAATDEDLRKVALHEAGHLVICEVISPGSVGLVSVRRKRTNSDCGGFVHLCKNITKEEHHILISLASKAAAELYYSDEYERGYSDDINRACEYIRDGISINAARGLSMFDVQTEMSREMSEGLNVRTEAVVHAELERYYLKAKNILLKNRDLLEKTADALMEKETLLFSDIRKICGSVTVTEVGV